MLILLSNNFFLVRKVVCRAIKHVRDRGIQDTTEKPPVKKKTYAGVRRLINYKLFISVNTFLSDIEAQNIVKIEHILLLIGEQFSSAWSKKTIDLPLSHSKIIQNWYKEGCSNVNSEHNIEMRNLPKYNI